MIGEIFDIRRFTLHDGPGIRTTVFLKGCHLRCVWCHNPEGLNPGKDIWVKKERCVECETCISICKEGAISRKESGIYIDKSKCTFCDDCIKACPAKAIQRIDTAIDVDELVETLLKDKIFYDESGGGVTLSGGEPLFQPKFALRILKKLKENDVHTCIETSMYANSRVFNSIIPYVDYFLVDIKLLDDKLHKKYTGVSNEIILNNFKHLITKTSSLRVRVPLIPGITANEENLGAIAKFVKEVAPGTQIELLNFNSFASSKYQMMGMEYYDNTARAFSDEDMAKFQNMLDV